jgi:hypothetical protein
MITRKVTIKELAESIGHDYQTTSGFVKVLVSIGAIRKAGFKPQEDGKRGKPSEMFEVDNEVDLVFWPELIEKEPLADLGESVGAATVTTLAPVETIVDTAVN